MVAAAFRSTFGCAKETTAGNALPATDFFPWTSLKTNVVPGFIEDNGVRGSMVDVYSFIPGIIHGELDFGGPCYADSLGYLIQSLLPNVATVGGSAPFSHTFAALNSADGQPKSLTFVENDGVQTIAYPGSKCSDLSLKFSDDGILEYTAKAMSLAPYPTRTVADGVITLTTTLTSATAAFQIRDVGSPIEGAGVPAGTYISAYVSATVVTLNQACTNAASLAITIGLVAPTASYSAVAAYAGWQVSCSIGGARTTSNVVLDAQLDLKRAVTLQAGADGNQTPLFAWSGVVAVSGKFTIVYDTTVDFLNMLNNVAPIVTLNFTQGAGAALTQIAVTMTNCSFTVAETDRGGDFVKLAVTFRARANTTDVGASGGYSPAKFTLQNAKPSGTYT